MFKTDNYICIYYSCLHKTMEVLYTRVSLHTIVNIVPRELNKNLERTIVKKIKDEMEGKCMKDGFIRSNSVFITGRSLGKTVQSQFNGALSYSVNYVADLCNPVEGDIFPCRALVINKMGIVLVSSEEEPSPVNVLLAKQHHMNDMEFESIKTGDVVYCKVIGKRFDSGETQISIIGKLSSKEEYKEFVNKKYSSPKTQKQVKEPEVEPEPEPEPEPEVEPEPEPEPEPEVEQPEPEPEVEQPEPEPEVEQPEPEPEPEPETKKESMESEGEPINYFSRSKDNKWLSTFNKGNPFEFKGRKYATVEHAFHSQKVVCGEESTESKKYQDLFTMDTPNYMGDDPKEAKKNGSKKSMKSMGNISICKTWDDDRVGIMKQITDTYYQANPELKEKLINTGKQPLIHKGFAIDAFWGMKGKKGEPDVGKNMHGKILMELRNEYTK